MAGLVTIVALVEVGMTVPVLLHARSASPSAAEAAGPYPSFLVVRQAFFGLNILSDAWLLLLLLLYTPIMGGVRNLFCCVLHVCYCCLGAVPVVL